MRRFLAVLGMVAALLAGGQVKSVASHYSFANLVGGSGSNDGMYLHMGVWTQDPASLMFTTSPSAYIGIDPGGSPTWGAQQVAGGQDANGLYYVNLTYPSYAPGPHLFGIDIDVVAGGWNVVFSVDGTPFFTQFVIETLPPLYVHLSISPDEQVFTTAISSPFGSQNWSWDNGEPKWATWNPAGTGAVYGSDYIQGGSNLGEAYGYFPFPVPLSAALTEQDVFTGNVAVALNAGLVEQDVLGGTLTRRRGVFKCPPVTYAGGLGDSPVRVGGIGDPPVRVGGLGDPAPYR